MLLRELSACPDLECLEIDFHVSPTVSGDLDFVDGKTVRPASIEQLFARCPRLVRTPELVALAKLHPRYNEHFSARLAAMSHWEHEETSECGDRVVGW
ncbi:hypothetical protein AURDEDRAFT_114833 [Auricularia subglabra TFB-10046 SS5]|nr:hypothetical protein AURDEDRAFT_114833 [Auricularia subglabra TFB-10046 SS5]